MTRRQEHGRTGQGNPRFSHSLFAEGIQGKEREQHLHTRLGELKSVLAEKQEEIRNLQVYADRTSDAIFKIENQLVRTFKQRLLTVAAELISLRPIFIPAMPVEGKLSDNMVLKPSRKQTEGFVELLMASGMGKKSANGLIFNITSRMSSNRLWLMERYFNVVLSPELAQRLVTNNGNIVYGAPSGYQNVVLPRKYQVTLTMDDIAAGNEGSTLTEEAKHRLRNAILTAVLFESNLNLVMLFGEHSKAFVDLAKVINEAMAVYAVEYRSNGCKSPIER
jgi:hypothetical protein